MATETKQTTDLAPKPQLHIGEQGIKLSTLDELHRWANMVAGTPFAPKGMGAREIMVAVTYGAELGLTPHQSIQSVAVINGRPTLYGDAPLALMKGSGMLEDIEEYFEGEGDKLAAVCIIKRKDQKTPHTHRFSVQDAKDAGLWGKAGPWKQYPKRMLQMRARGFCGRDAFPDTLKGIVFEDEARDTEARIEHIRKPGQSASESLAESFVEIPDAQPTTLEQPSDMLINTGEAK